MPDDSILSYADAARLYNELEARAAARRRSYPRKDGHARRPRRTLGYALAASSAVTVAAAIGIALAVGGGSAGQHSATSSATGSLGDSKQGIPYLGFRPVPIGTNPLSGGRRVTLAEAARLLGATVPTPNTALANPDNLSVVWGVRGEITLDYVNTQIRISVKPANRILRHDALTTFEKMANDLEMSPGALFINGDPAVADGGTPTNPGFAQVVRNGLSVVVMGHRSAAQLIAIADSLTT